MRRCPKGAPSLPIVFDTQGALWRDASASGWSQLWRDAHASTHSVCAPIGVECREVSDIVHVWPIRMPFQSASHQTPNQVVTSGSPITRDSKSRHDAVGVPIAQTVISLCSKHARLALPVPVDEACLAARANTLNQFAVVKNDPSFSGNSALRGRVLGFALIGVRTGAVRKFKLESISRIAIFCVHGMRRLVADRCRSIVQPSRSA